MATKSAEGAKAKNIESKQQSFHTYTIHGLIVVGGYIPLINANFHE